MIVTRFFRIDTTTIPGHYLSDVELSEEDGEGLSIAEVANTLREDKDSLDALLILGKDGQDVFGMPGVHKVIRDLRPKRLKVVVATPGHHPDAVSDLVGAGYVDHIVLQLDRFPTRDQLNTMEAARKEGCPFSVRMTVGKDGITSDDIGRIADLVSGAYLILLKQAHGNAYKINEVTSMAKALKPFAKEVKIS